MVTLAIIQPSAKSGGACGLGHTPFRNKNEYAFVFQKCAEDPLVEEERQTEDIGEQSFTPLNCLQQLATKPILLLQPQLLAIITLCKEVGPK